MHRWIGLVITLAALASSSAVFAKEKPKAPQAATALNEILADIKWGDSKEEVFKKIKTREMDKLREDKKITSDAILMQKGRKELLDRLALAEKSYARLEGTETGYEVSVIADEFSPNNGESFFRMKDKVAQRFYFFIDGKFYKLAVAYNATYLRGVPFESFVGSSVKKYGRPAVAEYDTIRQKEQLSLVSWQDPETTLNVKNKKELFDTYTMVFIDRQMVKRLEASNRKFGGSDKSEEEVSAAVQALTQEGDYSSNANVLDGLVGNTKVDLSMGRPQDDKAPKYSEEDGGEVASADAAKKAKKAKKAKAKKAAKKKVEKGPDFGNLSTKASDDLIIY